MQCRQREIQLGGQWREYPSRFLPKALRIFLYIPAERQLRLSLVRRLIAKGWTEWDSNSRRRWLRVLGSVCRRVGAWRAGSSGLTNSSVSPRFACPPRRLRGAPATEAPGSVTGCPGREIAAAATWDRGLAPLRCLPAGPVPAPHSPRTGAAGSCERASYSAPASLVFLF